MASANKIQLSPEERPVWAVDDLTQTAADKASSLLQENHDRFHIFFNYEQFHNHIAHQLLSLYAIGATSDDLQALYKPNAAYQRPKVETSFELAEEMYRDPQKFDECLGNEDHYGDFLAFFKARIAEAGWQTVLLEWVFAGTPRAEDLFTRVMGGLLHPFIHLGFGVEFNQGAIVAEALAEACVHDTWQGKLLLAAEQKANAARPTSTPVTLIALLEKYPPSQKLAAAPRFTDANKIRDGIMVRAPEEMIDWAARYTVAPSEVNDRIAELLNFNAYYTTAAQRPPYKAKLDFFYIHTLNASIFLPALCAALPIAQQVRLLEWKARMDLAMYVSRGCPPLDLTEVTTYTPEAGGQLDSWDGIWERLRGLQDDGHAVKCLRALRAGMELCAGKEGNKDWKVRGEDAWLRAANMAIDSVERQEGQGGRWVRSCGFDEAWEGIALREGQANGHGKANGTSSL